MEEIETFSAQIYATLEELKYQLDQYIDKLKGWNPDTNESLDFSVTRGRYQDSTYAFETILRYPNLGEERRVLLGYVEFIEIVTTPKAITEVRIDAYKKRHPITYSGHGKRSADISILLKLPLYFSEYFEYVDPTKIPQRPQGSIIGFDKVHDPLEDTENERESENQETVEPESQPAADTPKSPLPKHPGTGVSPIELIPARILLPALSSEENSAPLSIEDARKILEDILSMKKIYKDYSLKTAQDILDKLCNSWLKSNRGLDGQWGPGVISQIVGGISPTTIGRYLKAFHKVGIKAIKVEVDGEEEIIPIPHRFK